MRLIAIIIAILSQQATNAQQGLKLISRVQPNQIVLRWAPTSPLCWKKANQFGYMLERITVTRNGSILPVPERKMIFDKPLMPRPADDWETLIHTSGKDSNFVAVLAQAIYGESFQVVTGENKDTSVKENASPSRITTLTREAQTRYGFGLLSADHCFPAAVYAALGYVDTDVKKGEKYLYRIYTLIPGNIMKVDTAGVFTGLDEYEPLPANNTIKGNFGDRMVMINWDYDRYRNMYNSYIIEKSGDSIHYTPTSDLPFVDLNKGGQKSTHSYFSDSLPENGKVFFYRIRGLNAFGETGPPSRPVWGMGLGALKEAPFFTGADIVSDTAVFLRWVFDPALESAVKNFEIRMSGRAMGVYKTVKADLSATERGFVYHHPQKLEGSYYFQIAAITKAGTKPAVSFPTFVQTIDSVPPAPPLAPKATVNKDGIIKIKWKRNKEKDIQGYKLFRATHAYEEYSAVFSTISKDTAYTDTVQMTLLNDTIYYRLVALDLRGNNSQYGAVGYAVKPDVIPPAAAVFTGYEVTGEGVQLSWDKSPSTDIKEYILRRAEGKDTTKMKVVKKWTPGDEVRSYTDAKVVTDGIYTYMLDVYDRTGLRSLNERPLTVKFYRVTDLVKPPVKGLDTYYDEDKNYADLFWTYKEKGVEEFSVYRAKGDESLTLWTVLPAQTFKIRDELIMKDTPYQYAVLVKFKDGTQSKLVTINRKF